MPLMGYVGATDYNWYQFLFNEQGAKPAAGKQGLDEVNFWQPSSKYNFQAIQPGAPFFFKLKRPYYAIAGFGIYVRHVRVPAWLAWESFETMNGARSRAEMLTAISQYRNDSIDSTGQYEIGCLLIAQPNFFAESEWIQQPSDWAGQIVQGKRYDLTTGEGKRIWEECMQRCRTDQNPVTAQESFQTRDPHRYGEPTLIRPRLGQGSFRVLVTKAYEGACCVTTEHSLPALEAAHIQPYAEGGEHDICNGLLLRSDIHKLFDCGYVTVTTGYHFEVSSRLKADYSNGKSYYGLHGHQINLPSNPSLMPDKTKLQWHNENKFLHR